MRKYTGDNLYPVEMELEIGDVKMNLDVPEGVWNPTPHGEHLGNMIVEKLDFEGETVLELGSGCGNHTILIAQKNPAKIIATEIEQEIVDNTQHNVEKHGIDIPMEYMVADWTNTDTPPVDVLITNPPFTKSGKRYYRYFIDTLINDAHKLVKPGGRLIFIQSSMANIRKSIELMEEWNMEVRIVGKTQNPFRDYYYEDERYMKMIETFPGAYTMLNGKEHETLVVFEARLETL